MSSHDKARAIVNAALERKADRPLALDVSALTSFTEAFVLLVGHSDRQVRASAEAVSEALSAQGERPLGGEGLDEGRWVLIDCNDVIVHVFEPEIRDLYGLERLWSDAPNINLLELGFDPAALEDAGSPSSGLQGRSPEFLR